MENWKKSVSAGLAILFFATTFVLLGIPNQEAPDEIQIQIDKTIQTKIAEDNKLTISESKHSWSKDIENITTTTSPEDFIFRIKRNNIEHVFYTVEEENPLIERYWGIAPNGQVFEFQQEYAPSPTWNYVLEEYNGDWVVFRKSITVFILQVWVIIIIFSFGIYGVTYEILKIIEYLVLCIKKITGHL
ncbi:hypothetical protein KAR26_02765 [Candidatus Parcubacteria bacterium]|nr:hypothetical protein [Candidatus Parcubacteria bacterium]